MQVLQVIEKQARRGSLNDTLTREYTRTFQVITDSPSCSQLLVMTASGIPLIYSSYTNFDGSETDIVSILTNIDAEQTGIPTNWIVTCKYTNKPSWAQDQQELNPLLRPALVSWDSENVNLPMVIDQNGTPCLTSAGNAYDPLPEYEDGRQTLVIERYEASYPQAAAYSYTNVCNTKKFAGYDPYCAYIKRIPGARVTENGLLYYKTKYEISLRVDSHRRRILDQDYRDITGKMFLDAVTGAPLSYPTLLAGTGYSVAKSVFTLNMIGGAGIADTVINMLYAGTIPANPFPPWTVDVDGYRQWDVIMVINPGGSNQEMVLLNGFPAVQAGHAAGSGYAAVPVIRGYGGSVATAHAQNEVVKVQAVYRLYRPYAAVDFTPLNLGY